MKIIRKYNKKTNHMYFKFTMVMPWGFLDDQEDIIFKIHGFSSKNPQRIGFSEHMWDTVYTTNSYEDALNAEDEMILRLKNKIDDRIKSQKQALKDYEIRTKNNIKTHKQFYEISEIKNIIRENKLKRLMKDEN